MDEEIERRSNIGYLARNWGRGVPLADFARKVARIAVS